ncbi:hypothetical protein MCOR25_005113 [Pyricularia grisea]|nr:hypothetical protein MCOR25_005113 [Pyricularia grisea]
MADAEQKPPQNQEPEGFSEEEKALFEKLNIGKEGGMPMPDFIKPSEVRSRTAGLAASIFKAYHSLQHIVGEHEATLARRWAGIKQKKKRKELLLAAAKAIEVAGESWKVPEGHRPDIDIWRDVREGGSDEKLFAAKDAARRAAFLWPHLNLEDLSRPEPLVLMLASRARNAPDAFAAADLERARFAMESLALMPHYLNRYTMMFDKRTKPEEYGELVAWEDLPEDSDKKWLFERRGIHPGEGLWLLEVQDVTYRFLLEACKKILHDIPEDQLLANGDAKTPTAQAVEPTTAAEFSALITKIAEEPYRSPAGLDRTQLLEPVQARLQEAKDHLQALREDPAYFEAVLNDWATHRREQLVDANGNPHPILAKSPQVFWGRVVNRVVNSALLDVVEWGVVLSKVKTLLALLDEHEPTLDEGKDLPAEVAFAFYALDHHVEQLKAGPFANITMGLVASPPMRPYFQLVTPESAEDKTLSIAAVEEAPAEESTRLLIRRLGVVQDEKQRQLVGLPAALDELEYLLTSQHPEAKAKITPWVAAQLSSLSVYSRLLRQVELFQPWAARFGADVQDKGVREALDGDFRRSVQAANVPKVTAYEVNERLIGMAMPGKNKFSYPLENVIAPGNADQIRRAEVNLDGFWGRVKVELERSGAMTGALKDVFAKRLRSRAGRARLASRPTVASVPTERPWRTGRFTPPRWPPRRPRRLRRRLLPPPLPPATEPPRTAPRPRRLIRTSDRSRCSSRCSTTRSPTPVQSRPRFRGPSLCTQCTRQDSQSSSCTGLHGSSSRRPRSAARHSWCRSLTLPRARCLRRRLGSSAGGWRGTMGGTGGRLSSNDVHVRGRLVSEGCSFGYGVVDAGC